MILKIKKLFKNDLVKNAGKLAGGTAMSQVLAFAFLPILSRTYSQEAFGLLAAFTAVVGFVSSYATLKYDTALVLPKDDKDAYSLLKLSNIAALIITILSIGVLFLPFSYFKEYQGLQLFIGIGVLLSVNYNNSSLWNIRFKHFNQTAVSNVVQSVAVFAFQFAFYYLYDIKGLIIGNICGIAISGLYLIWTRKFDWSVYKSVGKDDMMQQAKRYKDFPKYFTAANAILSFSASLPILLFMKYIPLAQIGLYGMALKIIGQPVALISNSLRSVILGDMAEKKNKRLPILKWYSKIFFGLFAISVVASVGLIFGANYIVEIFLGKKWSLSGEYVVMLIPLLIGLMIATPGIAAIRVFEMQKYNFNYSIVSLIFKAGTLLSLFTWTNLSFEYIIFIYACVNLLLILGNNSIILIKIKSYEKKIEKHRK